MYNYKGWNFPSIDSHFSPYVEEFPITTYQQLSIDIACQFVKKFETVVDVGANLGLHSVRFSKLFKEVHSFEPSATNFECLTLNTITLKNIKLYNVGLGGNTTTESLSIPSDSKNCGLHSIKDFKNFEGSLITETINIFLLDEYNISPDLIKIDTQGFELEILKGSINTLKKYSPVLIIEIEKKEEFKLISNFLLGLNYTLADSVKKDKIWIRNNV